MKLRIIEILGQNHMTPIQFNAVKDHSKVYGLYTYYGEVCVLKGGKDLDFDDLTEKEQKDVLKMVESKDWKLNESLQ